MLMSTAGCLDDPVGRHLLARTHHEAVARLDLVDRDAALAPVGVQDGGVLRPQLQQAFSAARRGAWRAARSRPARMKVVTIDAVSR